MKDDKLCHLINEQSSALDHYPFLCPQALPSSFLHFYLSMSLFFFSPAMLFVWKAASLIANMTPPLPILPVSIVFPAAGVLLPLYLA